MEYISANVIANFLGLGWGATPLGLKAMEELAKLEEERKGKKPKSASNEMCTFLILNNFIITVDTGQCHCLSKPVRKCKSGRG